MTRVAAIDCGTNSLPALVLRCVTKRAGVEEVVASETDILDGIAWALVERAAGAPRARHGLRA